MPCATCSACACTGCGLACIDRYAVSARTGRGVLWIAQGLDALGVQAWLSGLELVWIPHGIQLLIQFLLFVPLVLLTALVITALFAMPALARLEAERDYP